MGAKSSVTYTARDADVIATGIAGLLSGDVAVVTGAAQGNGAAIARGLAQSGAVVRLADIDLDGALVVASDITRAGGRASAVALDVADRAQCAEVARGCTVNEGIGIRDNAIAPGLIATPLTAASRSQPAVMEELFAHALMKRFAEPEELVGAVLFLVSRLSTFVTGAIMAVDGGFLAI